MSTRRFIALGGLLILIGAGCQTGMTAGQVSEEDQMSPEAFSDTDSMQVNNETMTLEHPGVLPEEKIQNKQVRIETDKGDIVFELFADSAPLAVSNFVYLAEQGFYNGIVFHRVEPGFVIQGGDPLGTGSGGPGYRFADELGEEHIPANLLERMENHPQKALYQKGVVAMANAGPNTNGSQFFIMLDDIPSANMPNLYSIFGEVLEGQDVVDSIAVGDVMNKVSIEDRK